MQRIMNIEKMQEEEKVKVFFRQNYYAHNYEQLDLEKNFKNMKGMMQFPLGSILDELQIKNFHNSSFVNMYLADVAKPQQFKFMDPKVRERMTVTELLGGGNKQSYRESINKKTIKRETNLK